MQRTMACPPPSWKEGKQGGVVADPPQTYFFGLPAVFSATWYPGLHL